MRNRKVVLFSFLSLILSCQVILAAPIGQAADSTPIVKRDTFPARGKNETILTVPQAGRYSIRAKSSQGTRIEVVDRIAGIMSSAGEAGQSDGRLDLNLDKGEYKIRLLSHREGRGNVKLSVFTFKDVKPVADPADYPLLTELELNHANMADLEQQSYWIELKERRILRLEVLGRALAECRLWKDGVVWEDIQPTVTEYEAEPGQPMTHIEFHHDLNAGLYLLRCYGGQPQKWSEEKGVFPLYLRLGIPFIGENGQRLITLSPFGRDTFLASKETNYFQLVRADKKQTQLTVRAWPNFASRFGAGISDSISKESRDPWCQVKTRETNELSQLVIISGKPGDSLEINYFKQEHWHEIKDQQARYWISSIHSAESRDALDVTAILANDVQKTPVKDQVLPVGAKKPLSRRINLLDSDNIFIFIEEKGSYMIGEDRSGGASADYQISPFMVRRPDKYREPPFLEAGREWELAAGYHVLTVRPKSKGILHFALYKKEDMLSNVLQSLFSKSVDPLKEKQGMPQKGIAWPDVAFNLKNRYILFLNQCSQVASGIVIRQLPLNLEEPLPVTLNPEQSVPVRIKVDKISEIEALGGECSLLSNGMPLLNHSILQPGEYSLELKNTDKTARVFNLLALPQAAPPSKPVVKQIEAALPILVENKPVFTDYDRGETKEFLLRVKEPAFYRLETTGLIATALKVRSYLVSSLFEAVENGIGRNALVQQYLKPGDYIVSVAAQGKTKGRAGLQLRKTPVEFSEELDLDNVVRKKVARDAAIGYRFKISQAGQYRLETLGLDKTFAYRLEEEGGWPLITTARNSYIQQDFDAGQYYYYSLPEPVESRRITYLKQIVPEKPIRGKGPHPLELNKPLENIWMETPERQADVYTVAVAAPIFARLAIEPEFEAVVYDAQGREAARSVRGDWKGNLAPGSFQIQVKSSEKTNRLPYRLSLETSDFIPGMIRAISQLPSVLDVSLGESGLVEISSFGRQDCRAVLLEEENGTMVAEADDSPTDWNFNISRELEAGRYKLQIESMTSEIVPFEVRMRMRTVRSTSELTSPFSVDEKLHKDILKIPFISAANEELLHLYLQKNASARMAVLKNNDIIAEGMGEIYIPLAASSRYTVMLWQEGDQSGEVKLKAEPLPAPRLILDQRVNMDNFRAARVENKTGCSMQAVSDRQPILFSPNLEQPCRKQGEANEPSVVGSGWLVLPAEGRLELSALEIKPNQEQSLHLPGPSLSFIVDSDSSHAQLLECESADVLAGVHFSPFPSKGQNPLSWAGIYMDRSLTLAGIPEARTFRSEIRIWEPPAPGRADAASGSYPDRISLRLKSFPLDKAERFPESGILDMTLPAGRAMKIPVDKSIFDLALAQGTAVLCWSGDEATAFAAAVADNTHEQMQTEQGFLYAFNRSGGDAPLRIVRISASAGAEFFFDPAKGYEKVFEQAGQIKLKVRDIPAGQFICLAGEDADSYFLSEDGRLILAKPLACLGPVSGYSEKRGMLVVNHGLGFVKIWAAAEKQLENTFIGNMDAAATGVWQGDEGILKNGVQKWPVTIAESCLLFGRLSTPGVLALFQADKPLAIRAGANLRDNNFFIFLEKGQYDLFTRPLAGYFREGSVALKKIIPIVLTPPQPEKDLLINADELQAFRFRVKVKGKIGVGLKCESDRLEAWLYGPKMNLLGTGPLLIRELESGEYYLIVSAGDKPVRYRPIILGSEGSLRAIPDEVLRDYLK